MKENFTSIIKWSEDTFPTASLEGQLEKFADEMKEWLATDRTDIVELADMAIVALSVARFSVAESMFCFECVIRQLNSTLFTGFDLENAIDEKMATNRKREWNFNNGQYQHKELTE